MFSGKLINQICKNSTKSLIEILQYKKQNYYIPTLQIIYNLFDDLSEIDKLTYKIYLKYRLKKVTKFANIINYPLIISSYLIFLLILLTSNIKINGLIDEDIKIIRQILFVCLKANYRLMRINLKDR